FTGAANIADLDLDVPVLTASWRSTYKTSVETAVNATAAAIAADRAYVENLVITDLGTTDGQTKALIESPSSQTAGALSAAIGDGLDGRVKRTVVGDGVNIELVGHPENVIAPDVTASVLLGDGRPGQENVIGRGVYANV